MGLPLAVEAGKKYLTIGFDVNKNRIIDLKVGFDRTREVSIKEFEEATKLTFTEKLLDLFNCNFYVVTVPTPIDKANQPNLEHLRDACNFVGTVLQKGNIVVFESTVFPGCTEEFCVPIIEEKTGLKFNRDFFCGYSPERLNPGDKEHRFTTIQKITSGSNKKTAKVVDELYKSLVIAGTHKVSSIKVAEAAKVIENAQRDINIAFVNELSLIFQRLNIDTKEVLEAAGTKWNFLNFSPGLVGGHCIGVDPFYLTYKAESVGYHPHIILAGRKINDSMGKEVATRVIKLLGQKRELSDNTKVLVLGFTFKENCPDTRNTHVIDIVHELQQYGIMVTIHDQHADVVQVKEEYGIQLAENVDWNYSAILLAVAHHEYIQFDWSNIRDKVPIIFDVKGALPKKWVDGRL